MTKRGVPFFSVLAAGSVAFLPDAVIVMICSRPLVAVSVISTALLVVSDPPTLVLVINNQFVVSDTGSVVPAPFVILR